MIGCGASFIPVDSANHSLPSSLYWLSQSFCLPNKQSASSRNRVWLELCVYSFMELPNCIMVSVSHLIRLGALWGTKRGTCARQLVARWSFFIVIMKCYTLIQYLFLSDLYNTIFLCIYFTKATCFIMTINTRQMHACLVTRIPRSKDRC